MQPKVINLTILSDLICPWCYIGHIELNRAIASFADSQVTFKIEHRPYKLQPSLQEDVNLERRQWYQERFGEEKAKAIEATVRARAQELGMDFPFEGVITQTVRAHRLLIKAWQLGGQAKQQPILEALYKSYFVDCKSLGDYELLAQIAEDEKLMEKDEAIKFLKSDELKEEVEQMCADARKKGVNGVPFTVIDGKWAVSGGQTADVYTQIFEKLMGKSRASTSPPPSGSIPDGPVCPATPTACEGKVCAAH